MSQFGQDANGSFKILSDGRALRFRRQMYNSLVTLSSSKEDQGWSDGW